MGPFLRILGCFDWVCDPFIGITREQLLKQNTLAHILRLFLLLTATKLWITSSKHAGKISFPTQVVRKKGKKGQIQILRIIMYVLGYYTSHTGTKNLFWSKNPLDQKTPKKKKSIFFQKNLDFRVKDKKSFFLRKEVLHYVVWLSRMTHFFEIFFRCANGNVLFLP